MRKPVQPESEAGAIVREEVALLDRVRSVVQAAAPQAGPRSSDYDADLLALRDQIADEKQEDVPSLVEQMTRVQALASGRRARAIAPIDAASPYFAHLRLEVDGRASDILIGRRGLIDRAAGVQIVDWRDAPVSQIYYRYDEGDDYEEELPSGTLKGVVKARRNVTINAGKLRRIGCAQGTFVASGSGDWFELEGQGIALLEGGAGTAARPPRQGPPRQKRRFETARAPHSENKQLPEIAALIDREQFDLITRPSSGIVVIQGGAGSGKTTVALHRIAWLVFNEKRYKPSRCLFVVPSEALARYVAGVLPALGVNGVPVTTWRSWARNLRRRLVPSAPDQYADETPHAVSRLKKHPGMLKLLEDAVASELEQARALVAERLAEAPGAPWVLTAWDDSAGKPPSERVRAVRAKLPQMDLPAQTAHLAELALKQAGARLRDVRRILFELYTDRGRLEALRSGLEPATTHEIEDLLRWCSAQLDPRRAPELDGIDEERLTPIDGLPLEADGTMEGGARERLDLEDDALLLRMIQLTRGGFERVDGAPLVYDHIAVDEAQDYSAAEIRVLHDALDERRSMTIAGDTAQRLIFDNAFRGWTELLADAGIDTPGDLVRPLKLAYRSTAQVMRFARRVLGPLAPAEEMSAREGAEVTLHALSGMGEAVAFVADALRSLIGREPSASVALLTRHTGQSAAWYEALRRAEVPSLRRVQRQDFHFAPGVDVTEIGQVKGLEFDYVIVLDVNGSVWPATVESRHLLHIGATRATHQLWLVSTGPVADWIAEAAQPGGQEESAVNQ